MSWAARRRAQILGGIGLIVIIVLAIMFYPAVYKAPTCTDGKKDGDELGVDCGGSCPYLCSFQIEQPVVRFTQAFAPGPGRTDVLAYVDNPNRTAFAKNVPYTLSFYGADNVLIGKTSGTLELPPAATAPVFVANLATGGQEVAQAFLTLDQSAINWQQGSDTRTLPSVGSPAVGGSVNTPRVSAALSNSSAFAIDNVTVVAAVFSASGNVITASKTIVPEIPPAGSAQAVFTWSEPFSSTPTRIDVLPIIPLP